MMHARATLRLFYGFLLGFFYFSLPLHKTSAGACGCKNGCVQCNASEENNTLFCYGQRIQRDLVDYKCNLSLNYSKYELYISQRSCKKIELEQVSRITLSSKSFTLSEKTNMTAYAIARGEDQKNCIVAKFTGTPSQMIHCDPPSANNIKFKRRHGVLQVTAEWKDKNVNQYYLMYREQNNTLWKEVLSQNNREVTVKNLTSYLSYKIQIQCVVTTECPQCPPSHPISIPQELADVPDIKDIEEQQVRNGEREIIIKWQYVHSEAVEHYYVTVRKASGEPSTVNIFQQINTSITLILCYSAYHISIIAINSAGPSPPAYKFIKAKKDPSALDGVLNVSVKANNSFSLSWSKNLALGYSCYSVEWWESEGNTSYKSFFEKKSSHEVTTQSVTFQPYKRYHFFLHARPYKNNCNLKNINNSEVTYGRAQAYLTEGRPLTAPENVTVTNITQNSFVITWTPMDDEDMSGFLRGYVVYYTVDSSEKNVTVDPHVNSYELKNLASRNLYHVQLAAYTSAGVGRKSDIKYIETKPDKSLLSLLMEWVYIVINSLA
ncbi:oncostatin-M-specific receptor subunit beta-like [Hoplias malabaricus]|uniref:oncostatin-M-specific receptor subunit beta-like n=1 Tax=Hoplias malabaricus TaxID=27720 RepID=UPI0034618A11